MLKKPFPSQCNFDPTLTYPAMILNVTRTFGTDFLEDLGCGSVLLQLNDQDHEKGTRGMNLTASWHL